MSQKNVDNSMLLSEIKKLHKEVAWLKNKIESWEPYIDTWEDIRSAGRVFAWGTGVLMAIGGAFLMLKQIFVKS